MIASGLVQPGLQFVRLLLYGEGAVVIENLWSQAEPAGLGEKTQGKLLALGCYPPIVSACNARMT